MPGLGQNRSKLGLVHGSTQPELGFGIHFCLCSLTMRFPQQVGPILIFSYLLYIIKNGEDASEETSRDDRFDFGTIA